MVAEGILTLSDRLFDETIKSSDKPVLVDFWAEWCGPCKLVAPVLEDLSREHGDRLAVAKLNVDDNPDVARRFQVMSIPTLMLFEDGELTKRIVGARSKSQLIKELGSVLD
ncbi:MAG: thioredoxin [Acidimicrobiia bacterium]